MKKTSLLMPNEPERESSRALDMFIVLLIFRGVLFIDKPRGLR